MAIKHIRKSGHSFDRRMRWAMKRHTVSRGGTLCGAPIGEDDMSLDSADGTLKLAALAHFPGGSKSAAEDAARLCQACVTILRK